MLPTKQKKGRRRGREGKGGDVAGAEEEEERGREGSAKAVELNSCFCLCYMPLSVKTAISSAKNIACYLA